jgi:arginyl-tRNA synthetase
MDYKNEIAKLIKVDGVGREEIAALLVDSALDGAGDISLPCFKLAARLKQSPKAIAEGIRDKIAAPAFLKKIEAVNGYLNFFLNREALAKDTLDAVYAAQAEYGKSSVGVGLTICIDYSSINIAKDFHIGHLSTTAIGAALYRIYGLLGYTAVGINHLGDWGTQFGKLIVAYKLWGDVKKIEKHGVAALQELYVKFHAEAENDPALEDSAREWFKKIEEGDPEATALFGRFKELTLKEVDKIYKRLGISFDSYNGESFYNDKMQPVLDELEKKGLLKTSEGARLVDLEPYGMQPCLLQKRDGASLYATRDIAAAQYRYDTYKFFKCLYVVAYQQNLHFKQVFKVIELMGRKWHKDLVHVSYGMVSLEDGAMSTRKGNVVRLKDCLDKAVKKSLEIIKLKNPALKNKKEVAEIVGTGAVVFSALYNNRIKDNVFSYDKILNFEGETGPYLQYTAARAGSVLKKAGGVSAGAAGADGGANNVGASNGGGINSASGGVAVQAISDYGGITNDEGYEVIKSLYKYPDALKEAAQNYEPSIVARLLMDIAQKYSKFYTEHRIIGQGGEVEKSRLGLTGAVAIVLKSGLGLLGIKTPEQM